MLCRHAKNLPTFGPSHPPENSHWPSRRHLHSFDLDSAAGKGRCVIKGASVRASLKNGRESAQPSSAHRCQLAVEF